MITIPMKTKAPLDQSSLPALNISAPAGVLTARNILTLNREKQPPQNHRPEPAPIHRQPSANSRPQNRAAGQTPLRQSQPPRTQNGSRSSIPPTGTTLHQNQPPQNRAAGQASLRQSQPPQTQNTVRLTPAPAQMQLPVLQKPVLKGQKTVLSSGRNLQAVRACFGWNTANPQCDADVSAFLLGADGKVPGDSWFVFYGQTASPDRSTQFHTVNTADREMITIDFTKLHTAVKKIVFVLTINNAYEKKLHFGMMKDAYIRILDNTDTELVSFKMTDYYSNVISMMIGEIYEYKGAWKFNAVGNGAARDLAGLCALYGVQVSD